MRQYIYLHGAEAIGVATFLTAILVIFLFSWHWYTHRKGTTLFITLIEAFLALVTTFIAVFFVAILIEAGLREPCNAEVAYKFHYFNAHLKDLCLEREDRAECPRDEEQLKAFNPQAYQELNACTQTKYSFDTATQEYRWLVWFGKGKSLLMVSPDFTGKISLDEGIQNGWWEL